MDRVLRKKKWTAQKLLLYIGLPLVVISLVAFMATTAGSSKLNVVKERLTITNVIYGPFQETIPINGEVLPIRTIFVDAIEGGQVEELYLEGGEMVKRGDLILKLKNANLELNYMNLETNLLEQLDQLRNTRITMEESALNLQEQLLLVEADVIAQKQAYDRAKALFKDSVISEAEYQDAKNPYEYSLNRRDLVKLRIQKDSMLRGQQVGQVESSISLVDRNLDAIQRNLGNLVIKAPIAGQLSSVRVEIGETVNQGQNLGQIDVLSGYKVRAQIDEHYIARIETGLRGTFPFSGNTYDVIIRKVYPEVLANGTFEVDMDFVGEVPDEIKRGQNLQIRLALSEASQALMVSKGGFYQHTGGNWAYVVDQDKGIAVKRDIRIGRQSDRYYEVLEGLDEGESVITSGYNSFNDIDILVLN